MKRGVLFFVLVFFSFVLSEKVLGDVPTIVIDGEVVASVAEPDSDSVVNRACAFMLDICMDDSHGYNLEHGWGPEYNCSALVATCYRVAGCDMPIHSTADMPDVLPQYGFTDVTSMVDLNTGAGLEKGDILWMRHPTGGMGHTELYVGSDMMAGAHGLGHNDTIPGDQDGNEISVVPFFSYHWERVFRPPASLCSPAIVIEDVTEPIVMDDGIVIEPIISDDVVVNDVTKMTEFGERTVSDVGLMWYCCFKKLYCF